MRKPMTTIELLQKFKSKKTGLSSEQLVNVMTQILKKINPVKQTLKGKMYLSLKTQDFYIKYENNVITIFLLNIQIFI